MLRRLVWFVPLLGLMGACAGSDGHPPTIDPGMHTGGTGSGGKGTTSSEGGADAPPDPENLFEGGFIDIPQVSDIVYDEGRGVLYVSTTEGGLATVELSSGVISTMGIGEGPLTGLDLSPDGALLAICENFFDAEAMEYWIHVLDLESGTTREIFFPQFFYLQEGTHSVAFTDSSSMFITSSFVASGYVPLLHLDLTDDAFVSIKEVNSDTLLQRSVDGSVIGFAEPVRAEGPFGAIRTDAPDSVVEGYAQSSLTNLAITNDGSTVALTARGLLKVFALDDAGLYVEQLGLVGDGRDPVAAVFSPVSSSLFVTWSKSFTDQSPGFIERYDTDTMEAQEMIHKAVPLAAERVGGFAPTRMKISSDGTLLFVTVEKGINVYPLDP